MTGIRVQLALLVSLSLGVGLVALGFLNEAEDRREKTEEVVRLTTQVLDTVGVTVALKIHDEREASIQDLLIALVADGRGPDFLELLVVGKDGRILGDADVPGFAHRGLDPFTRAAMSSDVALVQMEGSVLRVGVPVVYQGRKATLLACSSFGRVESAVFRARARFLTGAMTVTSLVALVLFLGLAQMVVRPLRLISDRAGALGLGDVLAPVPPLPGRELAALGVTLNQMAERIAEGRAELERKVEERTAELTHANAQLERLAVTDGLTGLFNHRRFQEQLGQEVLRAGRTGRPLSVLMADVDFFKRFNDSFGHPAGDVLLRDLAGVLQNGLRVTDLLARYGGEEFAAILPETPPELAKQVAGRLREGVDAKLNEGDVPHHVTISVGVATLMPGQGPQELVSAADKALYRAKAEGRNRVVVA